MRPALRTLQGGHQCSWMAAPDRTSNSGSSIAHFPRCTSRAWRTGQRCGRRRSFAESHLHCNSPCSRFACTPRPLYTAQLGPIGRWPRSSAPPRFHNCSSTRRRAPRTALGTSVWRCSRRRTAPRPRPAGLAGRCNHWRSLVWQPRAKPPAVARGPGTWGASSGHADGARTTTSAQGRQTTGFWHVGRSGTHPPSYHAAGQRTPPTRVRGNVWRSVVDDTQGMIQRAPTGQPPADSSDVRQLPRKERRKDSLSCACGACLKYQRSATSPQLPARPPRREQPPRWQPPQPPAVCVQNVLSGPAGVAGTGAAEVDSRGESRTWTCTRWTREGGAIRSDGTGSDAARLTERGRDGRLYYRRQPAQQPQGAGTRCYHRTMVSYHRH